MKNLDYKKMLIEIDDLVNNDWNAEMEMRLLPKSGGYTQQEARIMAKVLGKIYSISHCLICKSCQSRYLLNNPPTKLPASPAKAGKSIS